jgi:hypothetical protein
MKKNFENIEDFINKMKNVSICSLFIKILVFFFPVFLRTSSSNEPWTWCSMIVTKQRHDHNEFQFNVRVVFKEHDSFFS